MEPWGTPKLNILFPYLTSEIRILYDLIQVELLVPHNSPVREIKYQHSKKPLTSVENT